MFITIDDFYNVDFYNECKEALKNNKVEFNEYINSKPPYNFYFEVDRPPTFINYEEAPNALERFLINVIEPIKPNDAYKFLRRESIKNRQAVKHYGYSEPFEAMEKSGEGIMFTARKEEILRISKEFPRKIWFMGKYFNRKYVIFFTDSLLIKNYIDPDQILVEGDNPIKLEVKLNRNIFQGKDKLKKYSETPYLLDGRFVQVQSVRPELTDKFVL